MFEPRHENLFFANAKTKAQISCGVTTQLISTFIFASKKVEEVKVIEKQ